MNRSREWLAGAVLGVGGLLCAGLMLEVGVRGLHLLPDRFWEPDPLLGARLVPGASGWWTQEEREFVIPIEINQHGRRDVERPWAKPAGTRRVLVLGDSFTEAMQVRLEETYVRRLESALHDRGDVGPVEVLSGGVSGYGTAGAALSFERDLHRYEPDLVLLAFYPGNDVQNNSAELEDRLPPVYGEDGTLERVGGNPRGPRAGLIPEWKSYRYLRKLILTQQPQLARLLVDWGLVKPQAMRGVPMHDGVPTAYGVFAVPRDEAWSDAWVRTEALLDRLHASVRDHDARLAVAVVTMRDQIYPEYWQEILRQHPAMQSRQWDLGQPQRRLERW